MTSGPDPAAVTHDGIQNKIGQLLELADKLPVNRPFNAADRLLIAELQNRQQAMDPVINQVQGIIAIAEKLADGLPFDEHDHHLLDQLALIGQQYAHQASSRLANASRGSLKRGGLVPR